MTKTINSIVVYLCLFLLIVMAIATVKSCFKQPTILTNIEKIREIRDDSISYWKDAYTREHASKIMAQAELAIIKSEYRPLIDSVLKTLNIQGDQLEQLTVIGLSNSNRIKLKVDTVYLKDSSTQYQFAHKDRWIDLKGTIGNPSYLDYTTYDSLIISGYVKRNGFLGLGKRETFIDVYSINPHTRINSLQGIRILKESPKRFGVGPYIGYGWNGNKWAPNIGISLSYSIIKF